MSTNCVFPPALEDKQIMAYLDDPDANQAIGDHLNNCPYCRKNLAEVDRFQKQLNSRLYRASCPPPEELGEYHLQLRESHLKLLPDSRRLVLAQHIRSCPFCTQEIAQLEEFLADLEPQPGIQQSVRVLIARLLGGQQGSMLEGLAHTGVRGEGDNSFTFKVNNIQIDLMAQEELDQPGMKKLLGLITGLDLNNFVVQVAQGGKIIMTKPIDDIGNFIIDNLSAGTYELIIQGTEPEVRTESFTVS